MKIKYIYILTFFLFTSSCSDSWLEEKPLDFYSPANSFTNPSDFNAAIARLYENVHNDLYQVNDLTVRSMFYPTDVAVDAIDPTHQLNLYADRLTPVTGQVQNMWSNLYRIIFDANVIIERIEDESVVFTRSEQRNEFKAEAMFFRAFAYRTLGIMYGGVPIVLEETQEPKRDFVRASREEVFQQIISDLTFASTHLPGINEVPQEGRISKAVADHLMSEVYVILENWDDAIAAATRVIDDPNFHLMTERFGSRMNEPGDVYWDLFRRNNQNRSSGNREGIWVSQFEYLVEGGGTSIGWPRFLVPLYWQLSDPDGVSLFTGPMNQYGGRGIGWFAPTPFLMDEVWESDFDNDIRNSEHNIIRDIKATNPNSEYFGQYIVESGAISNFPNIWDRWWNVIFAKIAPINNFPDEFVLNAESGLLNNQSNDMMTDNYIFRLAETYLLRAEAHLGKRDMASAAADINVVRERSNANPVSAAEVNIDYILDERARELCWEELRLLTLMRLNLLVDRVKRYNTMTGDNILDHQNLWPIPFREIETNTEAELTQNPGYF
ncbi:RagB/SusD family nutrient uptake outer membrane protein [Cyclobacterium sp. SYSU L10401]|uniref:RagB/SusD family nutrient uptake outer membrane protein n=1 Tax=Cyclobacterium sp. SYSU L10401 TaxID=2678657 RepID=UPI0013D2AFB1|nr:RagB/SusD family nutrient uptake outer membrane protein [Cyclobacterium sp. SYSU L10401]